MERDILRDRWVNGHREWELRHLSQSTCPVSHSVCCQERKYYMKINANTGNGGTDIYCIKITGKHSQI
jgi:hypothetical protein